MKSWNYNFVIFIILVLTSIVSVIFYFYLYNLNKKLLDIEDLIINQEKYENLLKDSLTFQNQIEELKENKIFLEEEKLFSEKEIIRLQEKIDFLSNENSKLESEVFTQKSKNNLKNDNLFKNEISSLQDKVISLEKKLASNLKNKETLQKENLSLSLRMEDYNLIKRDYEILLLNNKDNIDLIKKNNNNYEDLEILKKKLENIGLINKNKVDTLEKTIFDLNQELVYFINYKKDLEKLNGLQVIFSGSLRYDVNLKQIVFKNNDFVDIQMIQDDFSGKLVGECGLPINVDTKKRCSATLMAEIIFNENGLFLKGKEIVDILSPEN